ncbi:MAG: hypothetical protein IH624_08790 [Phycisphaerae bacterium]|nr:hypothetical protein [Phycisphaerae bacterium]
MVLSRMSIQWQIGVAVALLFFGGASEASAGRPGRTIAEPLPQHPGNIYLEEQSVEVVVPEGTAAEVCSWRVLDDAGKEIQRHVLAKGSGLPAKIVPGPLPIGWYRVEFLDEKGECVQWTTAAVLKKLAAPTPEDSPICVDSATAWFADGRPDDQAKLASLAALAGVNWVRDRLTWGQLEPERGRFVERQTTYDTAAAIQTQHGLGVLQVFHGAPRWAWNSELDGERPGGRFPRDLRDVYRFCRAMAVRFKGRVHAWEPWNEANVDVFGGHTVDEMCSYQKAAFLGYKAGDCDVTVGWNVYTTIPTQEHTRGLLDNAVWPYFDTYNIHTYEWAHDYEGLWDAAREAACGKPLWVTEADRGLKYVTPEPWCELSREDEIHKAEYIPQSYACSLQAGSVRHFHFILGHYYETNNGAQFGLLRKDMTPRPGYVALAAAGRLLAGAVCLGRWPQPDRPDVYVYAFRARPDGVERDVLVAWAEKKVDWPQRRQTRVAWPLPEGWAAEGVYDYLGRSLEKMPEELTSAAVYIVLPAGRTRDVPLQTVAHSAPRAGTASPVVLQVQMPKSHSMKIEPRPWSQGFEYKIAAGRPWRLMMYVYNFSETPAAGRITVSDRPEGWVLSQRQWEVTIAPMGRELLESDLLAAEEGAGAIRLTGDFGASGKPVLSFQMNVYNEVKGH